MLNRLFYFFIFIIFGACTNQDKEDANILFLKGVVESRKFHHRQAIYYYREALKKRNDFSDVYNNLGSAYLNLGNADSAAICFSEALKLDKDFDLARYNLADVRFRQGLFAESLETLQTLSQSYQDSCTYCILSGNCEAGLYHYKEAKGYYDKALHLQPNNTEAMTNRGFVFYQERNYDAAQKDFEKALKINPKQSFALNNLALVLAKKRNYAQAIQLVDKAIETQQNDAYLNNKAYFLLKIGEHQAANGFIEQVLRRNPNDLYAQRNQAIYWLETGQVQRSITALQKIYALDASVENLHYFLAKAYTKINKPTEARKLFKQAQDLGQGE